MLNIHFIRDIFWTIQPMEHAHFVTLAEVQCNRRSDSSKLCFIKAVYRVGLFQAWAFGAISSGISHEERCEREIAWYHAASLETHMFFVQGGVGTADKYDCIWLSVNQVIMWRKMSDVSDYLRAVLSYSVFKVRRLFRGSLAEQSGCTYADRWIHW